MAHWTRFEKEQETDVKTLVTCLSGLQDEGDNNYQLALQYAWSNFRFHRYLDVSSHQIHRTLDGIYEKLVIHSDLNKAESWKRLTEEFLTLPLSNTEGIKTEAHYAILSLLLCLSDSPSKNDYIEKPRQKQTEEDEPFDWGKYLREGEDIGLSPDVGTPEWSDISEEDDQEPLSREDSGIQVDRTPQDDAEKKSAPPVVSWKAGEPDARTWLEQHIVPQYWTARASRFSHSSHLHSNLAAIWDQHLYTTDPLYTPEDKTFVTETQVIRETLWLLSGVKKLFIFHLNDGKVTVRSDIVVTHMTHNCLRSVLEQIAAYGQVVFRLQKFMDEVTGHCSENSLPGTLPTPKKAAEAPFRTYQAFMWALYKYFMSFKEELAEIEKCIINKDETVTLALVVDKLAPRLAQLKVLHKVFSTGIAEVPPDTRNVVRASHLLNTLYKAILEYDNVGEASEQTVSLLFFLWVETVRPYLEIVDEWIVHGHLFDPAKEFIIQRNKDVPVNHRDFWYATYTLYSVSEKTENEDKMSDNASGSSGSDQAPASRQHTMVSFLRPVLKQIIMAGKSMQLLKNLKCKLLQQQDFSRALEREFVLVATCNLNSFAITSARRVGKLHNVCNKEPFLNIYTDKVVFQVNPASLPKVLYKDPLHPNIPLHDGSGRSFHRPIRVNDMRCSELQERILQAGNHLCRLRPQQTISEKHQDADRKSLYTLFLESVQSRLQHGKDSASDIITEQQVNKQSLIKMQSIVAKHLELNDVHDPLLAINFARLYLEQSDFLETFTCGDVSVDRSSESVTCQSFELTLRSCLYPHIDKQYLECCGNLMQTLKEEYKLVEYLQSMRNFFLLEAGDTMYDFYTSIFDKIREKESWQNVVFLNVQLQEAVGQRYPEDSTRLSIFFENVDLVKKKLPVHTLDGIVLSYKVPWPVDIVISSECQKIYNQIFLLLLLIKWAKYSLDVLQFNELVNTTEKESPKKDFGSEQQLISHLISPAEPKKQLIHRMFLLRVKLMHFVNSLHNYMMTRILHSTGLEFQHQVEEAKDLDQLIKIHYRYLSTIHDRCLLREKVSSVKEAIMKVMNVVLMFADRWHAGLGAWKAESIMKMESDFTNCHKFLVKVLNKAVCRGSFPHLESLALSLMAGMEQS